MDEEAVLLDLLLCKMALRVVADYGCSCTYEDQCPACFAEDMLQRLASKRRQAKECVVTDAPKPIKFLEFL